MTYQTMVGGALVAGMSALRRTDAETAWSSGRMIITFITRDGVGWCVEGVSVLVGTGYWSHGRGVVPSLDAEDLSNVTTGDVVKIPYFNIYIYYILTRFLISNKLFRITHQKHPK